LMLITTTAFAQKYTISGTVTDASNGEKLIGANVFLKGTTIGVASDANGHFSMVAPKGNYVIRCSYVGYGTKEVSINLTNNMNINFKLRETDFELSVTVLADRAIERKTPVAFTNISKKNMEMKLGSRDVPLVLNTTPSVYATQSGGGAGDARINVRGFNQRNVAIMINGVPVNDMENGWVYWSNWDGVGDATSSIQLQRGLSAVNLATPSIGGTMNIITDPTAIKKGFKYKQEYGSGNFKKSTFFASTGLIDNKFALSTTIVRKTGDGLIDKTWTDSWAFYIGASYNVNANNRVELYALGAPQLHGQNLYKQNVAAYSHDFAKSLGFSQAALDKFPQAAAGRFYNENWNTVNSSYNGKQYWNENLFFGAKTGPHERHSSGFINERENFFNKPIVNLNWYSQLSEKANLYTTFYWSGGTGGGTGTLGHLSWDYSGPSRVANWDATIAANRANYDSTAGKTVSKGILRNSRNDQNTWGVISKLYYKLNDNLKASVGIDARYASIDHYREVRDLLGGQVYHSTASDFWTPAQQYRGLGDKINYNNTNTVKWLGGYIQSEYSKDRLTAYGTFGFSTIKYDFTDHFKKNASGGERNVVSNALNGYQIKGGLSYRINADVSVYGNAGYVSKAPIFDNAIDDRSGVAIKNPLNEKFVDIEGGFNIKALNNTLTFNGNVYYTTWKDKSNTRTVQKANGEDALIALRGIDSRHVGVELEASYRPVRFFSISSALSLGNWKYTSDASGTYKDYNNPNSVDQNFNYYINNLKVGDAPQTQFNIVATVTPFSGFTAQVVFKNNSNFYADWEPTSRTNPNDRAQSWLTPSYSVWDLHLSMNVMHVDGADFTVFAHVFNLGDTIYIQDAVDNSRYNAYRGNGKTHSADDAEVFLGLPRSFNLGITATF